MKQGLVWTIIDIVKVAYDKLDNRKSYLVFGALIAAGLANYFFGYLPGVPEVIAWVGAWGVAQRSKEAKKIQASAVLADALKAAVSPQPVAKKKAKAKKK